MLDIVDYIAYELCFGDYICDGCGNVLITYDEESNLYPGDNVAVSCSECGKDFIITID